MKRPSLPWLAGLALALLLLLIITQSGSSREAASTAQLTVHNSQSAHYILSWDSVAGGSGVLSSTNYKLRQTIGHPSVGNMTNTNYALHAGYWQWFYLKVFLPLIRR